MNINNKVLLQVISALTIVALMALWVIQSEGAFHPLEWVTVGLISIIIGFMLLMAFDTYKNEKMGLATEDEFSRTIKEKAESKAFQFSIYMWTFIILFVRDISPQSKIILGLGLISMGMVFLFNRFRFSKIGISDEDAD
ncbi:MAG: hypothetical protein AAFN93_20255 [Bacteroidota bacterium]